MGENSARSSAQTITRTVEGFLGRYRGNTRTLYEIDLRIFTEWCESASVDPLTATRSEIERFARYLENERRNGAATVAHRLGVLRVFYRIAVADGVVDRDPTVFLNIPKVHRDPAGIAWLDRSQMGRLLRAARDKGPHYEALVTLMGVLGLRVSEACAVNIEDFREDELGYRTLRVVGKGSKPATIPIPVPVLRVLEKARGDRTSGPLIVTRNGNRQCRSGAHQWIKRLALEAGVDRRISPHSLRHSSITAALDAGVELRDAQIFARHADPRTTAHYDRRRYDLDRHAAHAVARWMHTAV